MRIRVNNASRRWLYHWFDRHGSRLASVVVCVFIAGLNSCARFGMVVSSIPVISYEGGLTSGLSSKKNLLPQNVNSKK